MLINPCLFLFLSIIIVRDFSPFSLFHYLFYLLMLYVLNIYAEINKTKLTTFLFLNKAIIILYFFNILISKLLSLIKYRGDFIFQIRNDNGIIRFNGFSSESSYVAFILIACMLCLIFLRQYIRRRDLYKYFMLMVVTIIISKTTFGFVGIGLVCLAMVNSHLIKKRIALIVVIIFLLNLDSNLYLERLWNIVNLIFQSDSLNYFVYKLVDVDGSASFRLLPSYEFFADIQLSDIQFWLGHGAGSSKLHFTNLYLAGEGNMGLGFIPAFIYEYGIIMATIICYILYTLFRGLPWYCFLLMFMAFFNCDFSTQLFLFLVICFAWLSNIMKWKETCVY